MGFLTRFATNFTAGCSDDATKDIFTTSYHVKHDTSLVRCEAMNYPYGNHYTYSGVQAHVSLPLQLLKRAGLENADRYVLPLINLYIILSFFLCAVSLYLLFRKLELPHWISVLGALAITFLSPQIWRIGYHLTLSYLCVIPLIFLLITNVLTTKKWGYSILFGIALVFFSIAHPYYLIFFAMVSGMATLWLLVGHLRARVRKQAPEWGLWRIVLTFCVQFVIPAVLFIFLTSIGDVALDRTSIPSGFFKYRGQLKGLFLPCSRSYFPHGAEDFDMSGESGSYLGIVAIAALAMLLAMGCVWLCKKVLKRNSGIPALLEHGTAPTRMVNFMLLCGGVLAVLCCYLPVLSQDTSFLAHVPFLPQLRAQGRFLWLFFYAANIAAIYYLYNLVAKLRSKVLKAALFALVFALFAFEDHSLGGGFKWAHNNAIPEWTDYENATPANAWVHRIRSADYQSLLVIPIFNIGTEQKDYYTNILSKAAVVSLKTGLPLHGCNGSRNSISQSYSNMALAWLPCQPYPFLKDLPSKKPILLITSDPIEWMNPNEARVVERATHLFSDYGLAFYRLEVDSLYRICQDTENELLADYNRNDMLRISDELSTNDSTRNFIFEPFEKMRNGIAFQGKGAFKWDMRREQVLYEGAWLGQATDTAEVSFYVSDYMGDLVGVSSLRVTGFRADGATYTLVHAGLSDHIAAIRDGWGVIKARFAVPKGVQKVSIAVYNIYKPSKTVYFDNLLIRADSTHVCIKSALPLFDNLPVPEAAH